VLGLQAGVRVRAERAFDGAKVQGAAAVVKDQDVSWFTHGKDGGGALVVDQMQQGGDRLVYQLHQVCVQARFDCRVPSFLAGIRVQRSRDCDDRPDPGAFQPGKSFLASWRSPRNMAQATFRGVWHSGEEACA
jgi:hypothetical protein